MKKNVYLYLIIFAFTANLNGLTLSDDMGSGSGVSLGTEEIIRATFKNNPLIKAAKYKLQSAELNYKLFEKEYSQFTPFMMKSEKTWENDPEDLGSIEIGAEKEFFSGSSIGLYSGDEVELSSDGVEHTQYLETEIQFPLFLSNKKLSRIIKRTFEENELYSAKLGYLNRVRKVIKYALEAYYDFVPRSEEVKKLKSYLLELDLVLQALPKNNNDAISQISGEKRWLDSQIQNKQLQVNNIELEFEQCIGLEKLPQLSIRNIPMKLKSDAFFGKYYIVTSFEDISKQALDQDTEIEVLKLVIKNAKEKKNLAKRGKWDIFAKANARVNYNSSLGVSDYSSYGVNLGMTIQRMDNTILNYSIQKADADILYVENEILARKREISTNINTMHQRAIETRKQLEGIVEILIERQDLYKHKKELLLAGNESVENYLRAFHAILDSESEYYHLKNKYLDSIRDLDFLCGSYFSYIDEFNQ